MTFPATRPPCAGKTIFTNPKIMSPDTVDAQQMCGHCPVLKQCALNALTAGDTLDHAHRAPAADVIQAGIWCTGDQKTANQLAAIAGVAPPHVGADQRYKPPEKCKGCGKPMVTRIKTQPVTPDVLTHAAHGYCRICDAKRRRAKDWQSTQPKHSTVFKWKAKRHGHNHRMGNPHHHANHPRSMPNRPDENQQGTQQGTQQTLF